MNTRLFNHIYNFYNIISIKETIYIENVNKYDPKFKNNYMAEYYIRFIGNDFYTRETYVFTAENENELEEKSCNIKQHYEIFKNEFLKFNPNIINIK